MFHFYIANFLSIWSMHCHLLGIFPLFVLTSLVKVSCIHHQDLKIDFLDQWQFLHRLAKFASILHNVVLLCAKIFLEV